MMNDDSKNVDMAVVKSELKHIRDDIMFLRKAITKVLDDHEKRLRSVERQSGWHWVAEVIIGVATAVAGGLGIRRP